MGRYFSGDIEGKFWFGVQDSNDASFFGGEEREPSFIEYYFSEDDMEDIEAGVKKCEDALGENKAKLDAFFEEKNSYQDSDIGVRVLGLPAPKNGKGWYEYEGEENAYRKQVADVLAWYARLSLGIKIRDCVKEKGECTFEAEI